MCGPLHSFYDGKMFDKEGTLALLDGLTPQPTSINVWVMQDYEAKIRAFKYRIDLSTMEASKTTLFNFLQKEMEWVSIACCLLTTPSKRVSFQF